MKGGKKKYDISELSGRSGGKKGVPLISASIY